MHLCRYNNTTVNRGFPRVSSNQNHNVLENHKPQSVSLLRRRTKSIISLLRLAAEISRCNYTSTEDPLIKTTSEAQHGKTPSAFNNHSDVCTRVAPLAPCTSYNKHGERCPIKHTHVNAVDAANSCYCHHHEALASQNQRLPGPCLFANALSHESLSL